QPDGCCGIDHHARARSVVLNHMQRAIQVSANLIMHANAIGSSFDEDGGISVRVFDHQVMIELQFGKTPPQRFRDGGAHGEVRYEVSIHDVNVDHANAGGLDFSDVLA